MSDVMSDVLDPVGEICKQSAYQKQHAPSELDCSDLPEGRIVRQGDVYLRLYYRGTPNEKNSWRESLHRGLYFNVNGWYHFGPAPGSYMTDYMTDSRIWFIIDPSYDHRPDRPLINFGFDRPDAAGLYSPRLDILMLVHRVRSPTQWVLQHPEHAHLILPAGDYEVWTQWDLEAERRVVD